MCNVFRFIAIELCRVLVWYKGQQCVLFLGLCLSETIIFFIFKIFGIRVSPCIRDRVVFGLVL